MKISNRYVCDNCAYESSKWLGKCPACGLWNTLQEEARGSRMAIPGKPGQKRYPCKVCDSGYKARIKRCGRVRPGSGRRHGARLSYTAGRQAGIGKSTLLLQVAQAIAQQGDAVLYLCGEESAADSPALPAAQG